MKGNYTSIELTYISIRFYPSKVRHCIEEVVLRNLKDKEYDHATAKSLAESLAD